MKKRRGVVDERETVLQFLGSRFPLYHQSNVFFRDVQYGLQELLKSRGRHITYDRAEALAREFVRARELDGTFVQMDRQSWTLNDPAFKTPVAGKQQGQA